MRSLGRHEPRPRSGALKRQVFDIVSRPPKPIRWRIVRRTGPYSAISLQWIYNADGPASLKGMWRRNAIFFHIPKAAGRSIVQSLPNGHARWHADAHDFLFAFGMRDFDRAFKFAFVRDLWSRTVSAFEFLRGGATNKADAAFGRHVLEPYEDVKDFVSRGLHRQEVQPILHFKSQVSCVEVPRNGRLVTGVIGRYETLTKGPKTIAKKLGAEVSLQHSNAGPEKVPQALSAESLSKITEIYRDDVDRLNYSYSVDQRAIAE